MAGDPSTPVARAALERLCQDYWPPLFAFAVCRGRDAHTAQDLTQAFFAHFIERGYLRAADRTRGRFRTFLLTCFQHFLIHEWEKNQAAKRGGQFVLLSWDEHSAALESRAASSAGLRPEGHYDREWALALMGRGLARLQTECCRGARAALPNPRALYAHGGNLVEVRACARRNIEVFEKQNLDAIIINAAGCGSTLKEYGHLLHGDSQWAERAAEFSAKVKDLTEILDTPKVQSPGSKVVT